MGIFDRWLAKRSQTHTATVTKSTADAVRRIATKQGLSLNEICLIVGRGADGALSLDIVEDLAATKDRRNAVAISQGLRVILPVALASTFADLVIDFEHGGFRFNSAATPQAFASDPARVELSPERLARLSPALRSDEDATERTAYYLREGDSRAAVVVSINPLVVAAYTDELCAVALLQFPQWLAVERQLKVGTRLLTSNSYVKGSDVASDLVRGEGAEFNYRNFTPLITDFLGANQDRVEQRKAEIPQSEWARTVALGEEAMARARGRYRDGCPPNSGKPAY